MIGLLMAMAGVRRCRDNELRLSRDELRQRSAAQSQLLKDVLADEQRRLTHKEVLAAADRALAIADQDVADFKRMQAEARQVPQSLYSARDLTMLAHLMRRAIECPELRPDVLAAGAKAFEVLGTES